MLMKAAVLKSPEKIEFEERNIREPSSNEVIVKVLHAGIAGTDLRIYKGILKSKLPLVLGQEFVGKVKEVGDTVKYFSEGDVVVIEPVLRCGRCEYCLSGRYNLCEKLEVLGVTTDGGFAEEIVLPEYALHRIPERVDVREAVLVNPAAVAFYAVKKAKASFGDRVAVLGGGVIGLSAIQFAAGQGAEVVLIEPVENRRHFAEEHFNVEAIAPEDVDELSGKMDAVIEASGNPEAIGSAIEIVKKGGRIAVAGAFGAETKLNFSLMVRKDIEVHGVWLYPNIFRKVIDALDKKRINLKQYITHEFKFEEAENAFKIAFSNEAIKILLNFD